MKAVAANDYLGFLDLVLHWQAPVPKAVPTPLSVRPPPLPVSGSHEPAWLPSVLVIGGSLPSDDVKRLQDHGCIVDTALSLADGVRKMDDRHWDVVAVHPHIQWDGDGMRFVRHFKCLRADNLPTGFKALFNRFRTAPFVVMPAPKAHQFAIFWTAVDWSVGDDRQINISDAILCARKKSD